METRAFAPLYINAGTSGAQGGLVPSLTVAGTASAVAGALPAGGNSNQIMVTNTTTAIAYVNFGDLALGAVTAATVAASLPVLPTSFRILSIDTSVTGVSVILSTGTGNVIFTRGEGIS